MADLLERIREVIKDLDLIEQVFPGSPHSLMHEVAEELDRLTAENQQLRAELEALRPQEDRGVPILGEVKDGKVFWIRVDVPPGQE